MKIDFVCTRDGACVEEILRENGVSRRLITKLKRVENGICRNGAFVRTIDTVHKGDVISISKQDERSLGGSSGLFAKAVYEDEYFVVYDKPPLMPVHPSIKHQGDTLGNYFSAMHPTLTFRPVNRLDRDTSGLCCIAKDAYSAKKLQHSIEKTYVAVVCGEMVQSGTVDAPIARERESIIKRCVRDDGQRAVTHYLPIKSKDGYTLLKIHLETGRTHQIRVHMAHMGFPLAGDDMYGGDCRDIERQALHCSELRIIHPISGEEICVTAPLPDDISKLID